MNIAEVVPEIPSLDFLRFLQKAASTRALEQFRSPKIHVHIKGDGSPATDADRGVEELICTTIAKAFPTHALYGEELGQRGAPESNWQWIIDPIDGTRSYLRGNEHWGCLIGLQYCGVPVACAVSMPAFGDHYTARFGDGAFWNETPMHVSQTTSIEDAVFTHSGFHSSPEMTSWYTCVDQCSEVRGVGNSLAHVAVARGTADIGLSLPNVHVWDVAALSCLVTMAGGQFNTGITSLESVGGAISSNGLLHKTAVNLLSAYLPAVNHSKQHV